MNNSSRTQNGQGVSSTALRNIEQIAKLALGAKKSGGTASRPQPSRKGNIVLDNGVELTPHQYLTYLGLKGILADQNAPKEPTAKDIAKWREDGTTANSVGTHLGSLRDKGLAEWTMIEKEKPDLLHVVTQPDLRVPLLTIASDHGVPAVVVEKPIAIAGEDYLQLRDLQARTSTKICINHQLHFHKRSLELQRSVEDGAIGDRRFLDASARLNLSGQGTHVLELVAAFNPGATPTSVFGQVSGGAGLHGGHCAPEQCVAAPRRTLWGRVGVDFGADLVQTLCLFGADLEQS